MEFSGQLARKRKARGLSQPDPAGSIKESGGGPPPLSSFFMSALCPAEEHQEHAVDHRCQGAENDHRPGDDEHPGRPCR